MWKFLKNNVRDMIQWYITHSANHITQCYTHTLHIHEALESIPNITRAKIKLNETQSNTFAMTQQLIFKVKSKMPSFGLHFQRDRVHHSKGAWNGSRNTKVADRVSSTHRKQSQSGKWGKAMINHQSPLPGTSFLQQGFTS